MTGPIAERLEAIYAAADAAVADAGPRCDASGRCCRFREYGHTLFISQIEAEYLLSRAPAFVGPVSDAACPYQVENLCTVRESRPLGCRVYFCDPAYQDTGARISERGVKELKALADEYELGWRYAPLHVFLREMGELPALRSEDSASRLNDERRSRPNRIPLGIVE
jgi:Fe-S-cluster containining protein